MVSRVSELDSRSEVYTRFSKAGGGGSIGQHSFSLCGINEASEVVELLAGEACKSGIGRGARIGGGESGDGGVGDALLV